MDPGAAAYMVVWAVGGWLLLSVVWHAAWTHATLRPQLFRRALLVAAATPLAVAPDFAVAEFTLPVEFGFVALFAALALSYCWVRRYTARASGGPWWLRRSRLCMPALRLRA